jgi:hypothetical protein
MQPGMTVSAVARLHGVSHPRRALLFLESRVREETGEPSSRATPEYAGATVTMIVALSSQHPLGTPGLGAGPLRLRHLAVVHMLLAGAPRW